VKHANDDEDDDDNDDDENGLWTVHPLDSSPISWTVRLLYCTFHLQSPQEHISSYSYGCRINSDHTILAVHNCISA